MISEELEPLYDWFHSRFKVEGTFLWKLVQVIRTVLIMSCLRMFDCYRNVPLTFRMFGSMFTSWNMNRLSAQAFLGLGLTVADYVILILSTILLTAVSLMQRSRSVRAQIRDLQFVRRMILWWGLFIVIILFGAYGIGYNESQFIYNQF
jgi:hypothetical protein